MWKGSLHIKHSSVKEHPFSGVKQKREQFKITQKPLRSLTDIDKLREAVRLPEEVSLYDWMLAHIYEFFENVSILYGSITKFCTPETCPIMSAGPKFAYYWYVNPNTTPVRVSAPDYVNKYLSWVAELLQDKTKLPAKEPDNMKEIFVLVDMIFRRMIRVIAHIYFSHFDAVVQLNEDAHLNTTLIHLILFCFEFNLVKQKEMQPLSAIILHLTQKSLKINESDDGGEELDYEDGVNLNENLERVEIDEAAVSSVKISELMGIEDYVQNIISEETEYREKLKQEEDMPNSKIVLRTPRRGDEEESSSDDEKSFLKIDSKTVGVFGQELSGRSLSIDREKEDLILLSEKAIAKKGNPRSLDKKSKSESLVNLSSTYKGPLVYSSKSKNMEKTPTFSPTPHPELRGKIRKEPEKDPLWEEIERRKSKKTTERPIDRPEKCIIS